MRSKSLAQALVQPLLHLRAASPGRSAAGGLGPSCRLHASPPSQNPHPRPAGGPLCRSLRIGPLLGTHCQLIALAAQGSYSKQAQHQRLGPNYSSFLTTLAVALFVQMAAPWRTQGCLAGFARVLLHDSTVQSLPPHLAAAFPGSASQSTPTTAALKIQWVCDLLSGAVVQLSLSSFRRNDQASAPDILSVVQKGDLILRDLGYFSLGVLAQLESQGRLFPFPSAWRGWRCGTLRTKSK